MSRVEYLLGASDVLNTPLGIFDANACSLISDVSAEILKSQVVRSYPDLAALAFWGRKANLQKLQNSFGDSESRMGWGLCFHITPSNIPVNFAFSFMFSLLAGNANIVRAPSKNYEQVDILCKFFAKAIKRYPTIAKRTAFVRYPKDTETTAFFCKNADARMVWGGDKTIATVKSLPAKPRCIDLAFADRYSVCILDGNAISNADYSVLRTLAEGFFNDTWLMDQNACSSPQLILWKNNSDQAREKFWGAAFDVAASKYRLPDVVAVEKYTRICSDAIKNNYVVSLKNNENLLYRVQLASLPSDISKYRGHGGFFYEYSLDDERELFSIITEKFQTITYFGIDPFRLKNQLFSHNIRGIDRIVPIGKAMEISTIWDGHDIVRTLSRIVTVR